MKKILNIVLLSAFVYSLTPSLTSCTDIDGDGIDSVLYQGNMPPEATQYRNPVWEPDLEYGAVFKGAAGYFAVAGETQWVKGLTYVAPVLQSSNLMNWSFNNQIEAFSSSVVRPAWTEGRLHSVTVGFAKTLSAGPYWMFYQLGNESAIGAAVATTGPGPYKDLGSVITEEGNIRNPYFAVFGVSWYLFYTTDSGTYLQELTLKASNKTDPETGDKELVASVTKKGTPKQVAGAGFEDVAVYRVGLNKYYLFGTVGNGNTTEIRYACGGKITGPYLDKEGKDILTEGKGTLLIESGSTVINPENVCGVFADASEKEYILYNATDSSKPVLASGYNRKPLFMNPLDKDEDGWFTSVITPEIGWVAPRFEN